LYNLHIPLVIAELDGMKMSVFLGEFLRFPVCVNPFSHFAFKQASFKPTSPWWKNDCRIFRDLIWYKDRGVVQKIGNDFHLNMRERAAMFINALKTIQKIRFHRPKEGKVRHIARYHSHMPVFTTAKNRLFFAQFAEVQTNDNTCCARRKAPYRC
jgi:hypothetical protein